MTRTTHTLFSILASVLLTACSALDFGIRGTVSLEDADAVLTEADESLKTGDHKSALDGLKALLQVEGLPTSQRTEATKMFATAAAQQIEMLSANPEGAEELADLVEEELPREIAVSAGIASAHSFIKNGEAEEAWKILRRLDERFPLHHERATAGRLLVDVGLTLSHDERSWWVFWSARSEGLACLEYVVLNHPSQSRCDEAYMRLGEMYAEDHQRSLAIDRYSDLILYHPKSPLRAAAQAHIPMLRLELLDSPEYDRNGLMLALAELEDWERRFPNHPLSEVVFQTHTDCLRRLSASDLGIARFYERIGNAEGREFHAKRAGKLARDAGDTELAASADDLLTTHGSADS